VFVSKRKARGWGCRVNLLVLFLGLSCSFSVVLAKQAAEKDDPFAALAVKRGADTAFDVSSELLGLGSTQALFVCDKEWLKKQIEAKKPLLSLLKNGCSTDQLATQGVTQEDIDGAVADLGCSEQQLKKDFINNISPQDLVTKGCAPDQMLAAGYTEKSLNDLGIQTKKLTVSSLKRFNERLESIQIKKIARDDSIDLLSDVFGSPGLFFLTGQTSIIGILMKWFNLGVISGVGILIGYTTLLGVMTTTREGKLMTQESKAISYFSLIRIVSGTSALVPTVTGYSAIQLALFWVVFQGITMANNIWDVVSYQFENNVDWIMPQFQDYQSFLSDISEDDKKKMNSIGDSTASPTMIKARELAYKVFTAELCSLQIHEVESRANIPNLNNVAVTPREDQVGASALKVYYNLLADADMKVSMPFIDFNNYSTACPNKVAKFFCGKLDLTIDKLNLRNDYWGLWATMKSKALFFLHQQLSVVAKKAFNDRGYTFQADASFYDKKDKDALADAEKTNQVAASTAKVKNASQSAYDTLNLEITKAAYEYASLLNYAMGKIYMVGGQMSANRRVIQGGWVTAGAMYGRIILPPKREPYVRPRINDHMESGDKKTTELGWDPAHNYPNSADGISVSKYGNLIDYYFNPKGVMTIYQTNDSGEAINSVDVTVEQRKIEESTAAIGTEDACPENNCGVGKMASDDPTKCDSNNLKGCQKKLERLKVAADTAKESQNNNGEVSSMMQSIVASFDYYLQIKINNDAAKGFQLGQMTPVQISLMKSVYFQRMQDDPDYFSELGGAPTSAKEVTSNQLTSFMKKQTSALYRWTYESCIDNSDQTCISCTKGADGSTNCLQSPLTENSDFKATMAVMINNSIEAIVPAATGTGWLAQMEHLLTHTLPNVANSVVSIMKNPMSLGGRKSDPEVEKTLKEQIDLFDRTMSGHIANQYGRMRALAESYMCAGIPLTSLLAPEDVKCTSDLAAFMPYGFIYWIPNFKWNNKYGGPLFASALGDMFVPYWHKDDMYYKFESYINEDIKVFAYQASTAWLYAFLGKESQWITGSKGGGGLEMSKLDIKSLVKNHARSKLWNPVLAGQRAGLLMFYASFNLLRNLTFDVLFANLRTSGKYMLRTAALNGIYKPMFLATKILAWIANVIKPFVIPFIIPIPIGLIIWGVLSAVQVPIRMFAHYLSMMAHFNAMYFAIETAMRNRFVPVAWAAAMPLMAVSGVLVVYLPALPFLIFTVTVFGWLISVIEAVFSIPIIAMGITHPKGHDLLGKAEQLVVMLMSVVVRPPAIIIGFILGILLSYASFWLLNAIFVPFLMQGGGYLDGQDIAGIGWYFKVLVILLVYTYACISVVNQSFSIVYRLPNYLVRWVGGNPDQGLEQEVLGEIQQQTSGQMQSFTGGMTQTMDQSKGGLSGGGGGAGSAEKVNHLGAYKGLGGGGGDKGGGK
jgi:hypothetical protein